MTDPEEPTAYAVRLSIQAQQDVIDAAFWLAEVTQEPLLAKQWADGLYQEIGRLANNPRACTVAERETRLFDRETRQMLYRRNTSSTAYRILYAVSEGGEEGPTVTIIHIRHGGRKSPTRAEAYRILANQ